MSILIKGMKMPSSCYDCELIDIVKDCPHYDIPNDAYCQIPWLRKRRHENCPLISVPPHGRLIDADALLKTNNPIGKMMVFGGEYVYSQSEIETAPTILEAEVE